MKIKIQSNCGISFVAYKNKEMSPNIQLASVHYKKSERNTYTKNLMADSTDSQTDPLLLKKQNHTRSLDDTIEHCIGSFSWGQFLRSVLVSFAWVFDAQQTFISVFTDSQPSWHCTDPLDEICNSAITSNNMCKIQRTSWNWDEPAKTSIISEWDLSCVAPFISGLPTSSFFIGCLAGGLILATLADSTLGRKNMLLVSCLMMSIAGILTVFSPNIWVYSALRFVTGFGRATIGTCALVLSTEMVGKRWRDKVGTVGFFCFTLGFLSLPAMAYFSRASSWKILYLLTSVPVIFYCFLVYFIVHESPRWLFVQGRKEEAINTLRNVTSLPPNGSSSNLSFSFSGLTIKSEPWNGDLYSAIKILLEKRWAFRRLSAVTTVAFGIGMMYYGMPLGVGNLDFNLYLSVTLNALTELPSALISFFVIGRLNRRSCMLFFTMVSGVTSIMCVMIDNKRRGLQIVVELISFFSACTAFNVLLIYTLELFPTCVRNSALSMVRQSLVLGGALSPVLIAAGSLFSYGVFGLVIGCCGLFTVCLPETRGQTICDTMDEEEQKQIINNDVC